MSAPCYVVLGIILSVLVMLPFVCYVVRCERANPITTRGR